MTINVQAELILLCREEEQGGGGEGERGNEEGEEIIWDVMEGVVLGDTGQGSGNGCDLNVHVQL